MRKKPRRAAYNAGLFDELIVDNFAGGGGASLGIETAMGRAVDVAINHDAEAVALHTVNHPHTRHYCEDVWSVDPLEATGGRPVGLAWFSPDCKHFSRAKGGKPVEKKIRGLAWVVVKWAKLVRPRVMMLENVREFQDWGPLVKAYDGEGFPILDDAGRPKLLPCPDRKGLTFKRWVGQIRNLGYQVEWRNLNAADYGAPTHRRRLFLVARCDGLPIVWPEPSHGPGRSKPYLTAASCIDWSIPCPSIFLTPEEARAAGVKRPLAPKTMRRIAMGLQRYVLDHPRPFIVRCAHGEGAGPAKRWGKGEHTLAEPLPTLTGTKDFALVTPFVAGVGGRAGDSPPTSANAPLGTITAKNDRALVMPFITAQYGERPGQAPRTHSTSEPIPTITPAGFPLVEVQLGEFRGQAATEPLATVTSVARPRGVCPLLIQYNGEKGGETRGQSVEVPVNTITSEPRFGLAAAHITKFFGGVVGQEASDPLPTVTATDHNGLVAAFVSRANFGDKPVDAVDEPLRTITAQGNHHWLAQADLSAAFVSKFNGKSVGSEPAEPLPTVTGGASHLAAVRAFLTKYYSTGIGQPCDEPLHSVTATDRFGLVMISGEPYQIVDVGLRMLVPRELFRANSFPDSYRIEIPFKGKPLSKSTQVRLCGNAVPPVMSAMLVRANLVDLEAIRLEREEVQHAG